MLASIFNADEPRWFKEIVDRAADLPRASQGWDYIEVKCRSKHREFRNRFHEARRFDLYARIGFAEYLRRSEVSAPRQAHYLLQKCSPFASNAELLNCISQIEFQSSHDAFEMAAGIEILRERLREMRAAREYYFKADQDYSRASVLVNKCAELKRRFQHSPTSLT